MATVLISDLLNTSGFTGKLIVSKTGEDEVRTMRIEDISPGRVTGTIDVLVAFREGEDEGADVLAGLFIHQLEDMLVGECDPGCPDCLALKEEA